MENEEKQASILSEAISKEMDLIYEYSKEHNDHKRNLFKLSVTVFSIASTVIIALLVNHEKIKGNGLQFILFLSFLGIGFINISIIHQYVQAHVAVILAVAQGNSLRKSKDMCIYATLEQAFPLQPSDIANQKTTYWKYFGKLRSAPTDNIDLTKRIRTQFWVSSAGLTMVIMSIVSSIPMIIPFVYCCVTGKVLFAIIILVVDSIYIYINIKTVKSGKKSILKSLDSHKQND